MNHSNLNFHHAEAGKPRVDSHQMLKELAHASLKHIPGSEAIIDKHFNQDQRIKPELRDPKPINLVMHHTYNR